ncbi:hypothetical protein GCM10027578_00700 [Spirosoma luteolum]
MIVSQTDTGWQLITQQAHGLLAFQLAMHWHPDHRPDFWPETLVALTEHDDGQEAWQGRNHLTKAGTPLHFQITEYSVEQCRNLIAIALEKSRWNALMVSMHTSFLYEPRRGEDAALDAFLDQQKTNQTRWRRQYEASRKQADYAYAFVQWCDALSLVLCLDQLPPEGRRLEVSLGPDGRSYYIRQRPDQTLALEPWPFDGPELTVAVEAYQLEQVTFANDNELYNAMQDATIKRLCWTFREA